MAQLQNLHQAAQQLEGEEGKACSHYTPNCTCPDPNCDVKAIAERVVGKDPKAHRMGYTLNGMLLGLSLFKEVCSGPGVGDLVPGLRATAGAALYIVDAIAAMGDNKALFEGLGKAVIDHSLVIFQTLRKLEKQKRQLDDEIRPKIERFMSTMTDIHAIIVKLQTRGRFTRFLFAHADKVELQKLRSTMEDTISSLKFYMITSIFTDNHMGGHGGAQSNGTQSNGAAPLSRAEIEAMATKPIEDIVQIVMKAEFADRAREYRDQQRILVNKTTSGANVKITSPLISFAGAQGVVNPVITNAGNVKTTNNQNTGNNFSVNNYTISIPGY